MCGGDSILAKVDVIVYDGEEIVPAAHDATFFVRDRPHG